MPLDQFYILMQATFWVVLIGGLLFLGNQVMEWINRFRGRK